MDAKRRVTMSRKAFVSEHTHLVKVLRSGTPAERKSEAKEQANELKAVRRKKR